MRWKHTFRKCWLLNSGRELCVYAGGGQKSWVPCATSSPAWAGSCLFLSFSSSGHACLLLSLNGCEAQVPRHLHYCASLASFSVADELLLRGLHVAVPCAKCMHRARGARVGSASTPSGRRVWCAVKGRWMVCVWGKRPFKRLCFKQDSFAFTVSSSVWWKYCRRENFCLGSKLQQPHV